jgi:glutamate/aspartate transport system permease protein
MTLQLMVMGVVGGVVLGTLLALMRLSHKLLCAWPAPTSTTSARSRCCW